MLYFTFAIFTRVAFASSVLSLGSDYPVKKEIRAPAPGPAAPESFYSEMQMDFDSFDASDPSAPPMMGTHTEQLLRVKKLPKQDRAVSKESFSSRTELTFEKVKNVSRVRVPGLKTPFETSADLGPILSDKPLLIRDDGKGTQKIENLEEVKKAALAQAKDGPARTTLNVMLSPDLVLKAGSGAGQDASYLSGLKGKQPGEKWKFTAVEQGMSLDYDCSFEGWAEAMGKKVAVIKIHSNKQRTTRQMPNGAPGVAEMEGEGLIYFEPTAPETLMAMETRILVEPTDDEVARLKANGQAVPRNRSIMRHRNHVFPL